VISGGIAVIKKDLGGIRVRINVLGGIVSQNTNDQGWFVVIKTKLTTKGKRECKEREDYIYIARG
jgi:hypothetical protein